MPNAKELRLEIGCGKGRFTCETAKLNPEVLFVAIERV
ncbi:MAG: tRNA (guanosine(46)-N7)-methyltransferase TrmB, partial [Oscillospiraceae bacterium]